MLCHAEHEALNTPRLEETPALLHRKPEESTILLRGVIASVQDKPPHFTSPLTNLVAQKQ